MTSGSLRYLAELQRDSAAHPSLPSQLTADDIRRVIRNMLETRLEHAEFLADSPKSVGTHEEIKHLTNAPEAKNAALSQVLADLEFGANNNWSIGSSTWFAAKQDCIRELLASMDGKIVTKEVECADNEAHRFTEEHPDLCLYDYIFWTNQKYKILITAAANKLNQRIPEEIVVGHVMSGLVNAAIMKNPYDDGCLIVLDNGLKCLTNNLSKLFISQYLRNLEKWVSLTAGVAETITIVDFYDRINNMMPDGIDIFKTIIHSYLYIGDPTAGERVRLNQVEHRAANSLEQCMELFVMGHELSHLILGHLKRALPVPETEKETETTT